MEKLKGYSLIITSFLACPCHLPVTLPILIALTAGTALGAFLANNVWLIVGVSTIYFVIALLLGFRYLGQDAQACEMPQRQVQTRMKSRSAKSENAKEV